MRRPVLLGLAVTAALLLAGCLEGGEELSSASTQPAPAAPTNETTTNASLDRGAEQANGSLANDTPEAEAASPEPDRSADPPRAHELTFGGPSGGVQEILQVEGSFGPNETCVPAGCARTIAGQGDPVHHDVELGAHVPAGVPVRVTGEIRYDQETTGDLHPNLRTSQAEIYGAKVTNNDGPSAIDVRLSSPPDDPVVLELGAHVPDGAGGLSYSGNLTITADPGRVPAGVPTGVPVPANAEAIRLSPVDGDWVRFTLWNASGERVTRTTVDEVPARVELANHTGAATYALQIEAPSSGARVAVVVPEAPAGSLQPLETTAIHGPTQEALPSQPVSGTFETSVPPVAVGVYERSSREVTVRTWEDPALQVRSPTGTVMDRTAGSAATLDTLLVGGSFDDRFTTAPAREALVPGTYEFQVTDHGDAGAAFGGFAIVYADAQGSG